MQLQSPVTATPVTRLLMSPAYQIPVCLTTMGRIAHLELGWRLAFGDLTR